MKTLDACSFVGYAKVRLQICIGQAIMPIIRWIYYILSDGYTIYYMMRGLERGWYTTLNHANIRLFFWNSYFFNYKVGSGQTFSWKKNIFQATETEWRKFLKSMLFYTGHRYRVQTTRMPITPFGAFPFFLKEKDTNTEWRKSKTPSSNVSVERLFKVGSTN